jgi:hypothetical protein
MAEEQQRRRSVSRATQPEAASALNSVAVELIVVAIVAIGSLMVVVRMDWPAWLELGGVAVVGMGCGGWLAMRRKSSPQGADQDSESGDGTNQE